MGFFQDAWAWASGTGKYGGLTDEEYRKQQQAEAKRINDQTAARVTRYQQDNNTLVAEANKNRAANEEYNKAINTRVDLLTPRQVDLITGRTGTTGGGGSFGGGGASGSWGEPKRAAAAAPAAQEPAPKRTVAVAKPSTAPKTTKPAKNTGFNEAFSPEYMASLAANSTPTNQETQAGEAAGGTPDLPTNPPAANTTQSFNIDNFRAEIDNYGVLPTHSFLVRFAPFNTKSGGLVSELTKYTTSNKDKLVMRCDNAILPAVSLIKEEAIRRYGYGPTEVVPYGVSFGDFTLQWIVDNNSEIVDFFNRWINVIVNHDSKGGADMDSEGQFNKYQPYEVGFKDDYSNSKVSVFVYDRKLNTTIEYNIFDVFPISIQSINLAWGDENQMMKYNVTFAFTDMIMKTPKSGDNAFYQAAQQEAAARAASSPNAEKPNPNDIVVTARNRLDLKTTGTLQFNSGIGVGGDYTKFDFGVTPEQQALIDKYAPVSKVPEFNIKIIP